MANESIRSSAGLMRELGAAWGSVGGLKLV